MSQVPKHSFQLPAVLENEADLTVDNGAPVSGKPSNLLRSGWAEAAQAIGDSGQAPLHMGDLPNEADEDWQW